MLFLLRFLAVSEKKPVLESQATQYCDFFPFKNKYILLKKWGLPTGHSYLYLPSPCFRTEKGTLELKMGAQEFLFLVEPALSSLAAVMPLTEF
jgi:hypothetical protein